MMLDPSYLGPRTPRCLPWSPMTMGRAMYMRACTLLTGAVSAKLPEAASALSRTRLFVAKQNHVVDHRLRITGGEQAEAARSATRNRGVSGRMDLVP